MSAPLPDWTAAVMRGWRSLALMNSNVTSAPSAFDGLGRLALQLDVGLGDEVHPADDVELGALGEGRRPPGGQDALEPSAAAAPAAASPTVPRKVRRPTAAVRALATSSRLDVSMSQSSLTCERALVGEAMLPARSQRLAPYAEHRLLEAFTTHRNSKTSLW